MFALQAKEFVDMFLLHCGRPFVQLIQLCGHNRARQRERLAHLLEDFSNLQDEVGCRRLFTRAFSLLDYVYVWGLTISFCMTG